MQPFGAAGDGGARTDGDGRAPPTLPRESQGTSFSSSAASSYPGGHGGDGGMHERTWQGAWQGGRQGAERAHWSGGLRGMAMAGGGVLSLAGLLSGRSMLGLGLGLAGLSLLARGASNRPLRSLLGAGSQGQAVEVEKTIRIDAAPEQVYEQFANYENFPRFMSNVVEVRDLGNRRSHWVVKGPAGSEFEWNSVLTEQTRPKRLAWRTEPGAEIEQTGSISFEPHRGGTLMTVRMSYSPPAGALGHGIATLLGSDPKRQMDDDLARMKAFIERGSMPAEAAQRARSSSRFLH
jgi:uncharacterized membrane protein